MASRLSTLVTTEQPPAQQRGAIPPAGETAYIIEGRPGYRFPTVDEACAEAADLMVRLRLWQPVKVREAGSERIVAMASRWETRDGQTGVHVVRLTRGAA